MLMLAITGGIACGKSLVATFLQERNIPVCDTDAIAHKLLDVGCSTYRDVIREFGDTIVGDQNQIDRSSLGRIVFSDSAKRVRLNNIMHPAIQRQWREWAAERERDGEAVAVVMIPLLFEVGGENGWDEIVSVISSRALQMERLRVRGLSDKEALERIKAQLPNEEKAAKADHVLMNNGSQEALKEQTFLLLDRILERHNARE